MTQHDLFPTGCQDWDSWLERTEAALTAKGYRKFDQKLKSEDFAYWRNFGTHSLGLFFYDYRQFFHDRIGLMFVTMLNGIDFRIDMVVSKPMSLDEAEQMAEKFNKHLRP
jgi:hypothetical protein